MLVASAAGVFLLVGHAPSDAGEPRAAAPPAIRSAPAPIPELQPPAPIVDPPHVAITIGKIAPHAHTRVGDAVVELPGTFELPRGDAPVALVFEAKGFRPKTIQITPDRAQTIDVALDHAARAPAGHADAPVDDHDIIHIQSFGNK